MATYFVSSADGNDANSGLTLDLPWATLEYALESGGLSAGDTVMIRRTHSEIPTSDIAPSYDGTALSPIIIAATPRAAHAISSSDWTNGSTSVTVDDADMDREKHQARYITGPDGYDYLITRVVDASTITIDREYAGSTVSNDATASIKADTSIAAWTAYDDSADTIKKTDWESDADDIPVIDFNDTNFRVAIASDNFLSFYCIEFKDSSDSGIINTVGSGISYFEGCLCKQNTSNNQVVSVFVGLLMFVRSTIEGSGSGSAQVGAYVNGGYLYLKDVAIYNCGDFGIGGFVCRVRLENVNIGVEIANGDEDIHMYNWCDCSGVDVKLGGTNGLVGIDNLGGGEPKVAIENYNKTFDAHRVFYTSGYYEKAAVSGETPNQKVSTNVVKITPNVNSLSTMNDPSIILTHDIDGVTTGAKTFKYWIYNDTGATINDGDAKGDIWLKAEYIVSYDDTSEYVRTEIFSAENTIADAADADDWDSLSVTLTPATTSKVRLTIYVSTYSAAGNIFVDPAVVIT